MGIVKYLPTTLANLALYLGLAALAHVGLTLVQPRQAGTMGR